MLFRSKQVVGLVAVAAAGVAMAYGAGAASGSGQVASVTTNPPIVTAPTGVDAHRAWQQFAACMSKNVGLRVTIMAPPLYGIRIAGPTSGQPPTPAQQAAFEARTHTANAICHHYLAAIQKNSNTSQDEARFRDRMLGFARCMRRHGVNVGDPIIKKVVGGFDVTVPPGPGVRTGSVRWHSAEASCRSLNPLLGGK